MGVEARLLPHQIGAGQRQSSGFSEQHRQGALVPSHALQIQRLTNSPLSLLGTQTLHEGRPEVVNRIERGEIQLRISHQDGNNARASLIICGVTAMRSSGSALSR